MLDFTAMAMLVVLCASWGLQQVAIKAVAADMSPVLQIGLRSGLSAVLIGLLMLFSRVRFWVRDGTWRPGLLAGSLFVIQGIAHEPVSAIIKATVPFFLLMILAVVMIAIWPDIVMFLPAQMSK